MPLVHRRKGETAAEWYQLLVKHLFWYNYQATEFRIGLFIYRVVYILIFLIKCVTYSLKFSNIYIYICMYIYIPIDSFSGSREQNLKIGIKEVCCYIKWDNKHNWKTPSWVCRNMYFSRNPHLTWVEVNNTCFQNI